MSNYRKCAGIIVFNRQKKVLACARRGRRDNQWQFPQGGIMKKETAAEAALRELTEETSIVSAKVIATLDSPLRYDFPGPVRRRMLKRGIDSPGQDMYWSLLYFYGSDSEININTSQPEFKAWEWADIGTMAARIVYFKQEVYRRAIERLRPVLESFDPAEA